MVTETHQLTEPLKINALCANNSLKPFVEHLNGTTNRKQRKETHLCDRDDTKIAQKGRNWGLG